MLIEFTVENFRSLREPVTLSALQGTRRRKPLASVNLAGWQRELLPVLGIFGEHGSGKSNLLLALDSLLEYMVSGDLMKGEVQFRFVPFRLDTESAEQPTCFVVLVYLEKCFYRYSLGFTHQEVAYEQLSYVPPHSQELRLLYRRDGQQWQFGPDFAGLHTRLNLDLKPYEPFISVLVRQKIKVLEPLARWLWLRWPGIGQNPAADRLMAARLGHNAPESRARVEELLARFGVAVAELEIQKSDSRSAEDEFQVYVWREAQTGRVRWPLQEESLGTQRLFGLAYRIVYGFSCRTLTLVDDLGMGLEPNCVQEILKLFQDPTLNPYGAQLVFTSQGKSLQKLLGRDQVWTTLKNEEGATGLTGLPRPSLPLAVPPQGSTSLAFDDP